LPLKGEQVWSDEPIKADREDVLARIDFADRVATVLQMASSGSSMVAGLVGPWGSGKTSLVNLIRARMDSSWEVRDFSPWATADLHSLLADFFAVIASSLPVDRGKKARQSLLACARVSVPVLAGVPAVGSALEGVASKAIEHLTDEGTWAERFADASKRIQKLKIKVLIVVDDVDRLHADELATLLKAIRLLGRFPGVHYLLAYDEATVLSVLSTSAIVGHDETRALAFLEKIVQLPLPVPPAQRPQLDALVNERLSELIREFSISVERDQTERFTFMYQTLMSRTLTTVRAVRRFFVQARAYLPLVGPDEVDFFDFVGLTYLRVHFPNVYGQIPHWFTDLVGRTRNMYKLFDTQTTVDWAARLEEIGVPTHLVGPVQEMLECLFPKMVGNTTSVAAMIGSRGTARRVGTPEYFDRYFALGVPVDDIPNADVRAGLDEALNGGGVHWDRIRRALADAQISADRRAQVIDKLAMFAQNRGPEDAVSLAMLALALAKELPIAPLFTAVGPQKCLAWSAAELSRALLDGLEPTDILAQLMTAAPDFESVRYVLEMAVNAAPPEGAVRRIAHEAAKTAAAMVLENLRQRDAASRAGVMTMIGFCREQGVVDHLQEQILGSIQSGEFSVEDVASRHVTISLNPETAEPWEIVGFETDRFTALIPQNAIRASGPYLDAVVSNDARDLSWPHLREVGRQHLARQS
jgi:hypothetical protein